MLDRFYLFPHRCLLHVRFLSSRSLDRQLNMVHIEIKSLKLVNWIGFICSTPLFCETLSMLNALLVWLALIWLLHKELGNSKCQLKKKKTQKATKKPLANKQILNYVFVFIFIECPERLFLNGEFKSQRRISFE